MLCNRKSALTAVATNQEVLTFCTMASRVGSKNFLGPHIYAICGMPQRMITFHEYNADATVFFVVVVICRLFFLSSSTNMYIFLATHLWLPLYACAWRLRYLFLSHLTNANLGDLLLC